MNLLLDQIDRGHNAEIFSGRAYGLRNIFPYWLAAEMNKGAYELERKLRHGFQRYAKPLKYGATGYLEGA